MFEEAPAGRLKSPPPLLTCTPYSCARHYKLLLNLASPTLPLSLRHSRPSRSLCRKGIALSSGLLELPDFAESPRLGDQDTGRDPYHHPSPEREIRSLREIPRILLPIDASCQYPTVESGFCHGSRESPLSSPPSSHAPRLIPAPKICLVGLKFDVPVAVPLRATTGSRKSPYLP
jgi:hypothetical protein